jgi:hypothetical protein
MTTSGVPAHPGSDSEETSMTKKLIASISILFGALAVASAREVVVLKGGKTLELSKPYVIRGSQALMTLKDGTLISVAAADIDRAATAVARRPKPVAAEQPTGPLSPAEAARAQKAHPKATVKIGDEDVGHVLDTGEEVPAAAAEADSALDARLEVVDFDQRPSGNTLNVKGTVRNTGHATAESISLSIAAIDEKGKTVATSNAAVAAGSLEAGSTATFTAALPTANRAASLRFTPRWSGAPSATKADGASAKGSQPANAAAAPAAAKPAPPPPPPPAEPKSTYKPQPDWAPPAANAPMTAPDDNRYGYIPGAHEETPPPPPPPPPPTR